MIPSTAKLALELKEVEIPTRTHKIVYDKNRVNGFADETEAMRQVIYLILGTERYEHPIYSWNYGVELFDLFGQPITYCISEIKRRVTEALLMDDRVKDVSDFTFEIDRSKVHATFVVTTIYGKIDSDVEVSI